MKLLIKVKSTVLFVCFILANLSAQEVMTTKDAISVLMENSYGIKIARNNRLIAENNASKAANGYQPTVDFRAGAGANLGGSNQKFSSGMEANVENAFSWNSTASLGANYTLYNKQRDLNFEQLKEQIQLSDFEIRQQMETDIFQLLSGYYQVAQLSENLNVLRQTVLLSKNRLERAQYRFDFGQGIRIDVLNAQVDIQRDSINLLNAIQQLENAKRNLNFVLGRDVNTAFTIDTTLNYIDDLSLESLLSDAERRNVDLQIIDKNLALSNFDLEIIDAGKQPIVTSTASYDFSFQDNPDESFITSSTSRGLNVGVNLAWNIFDGGVRKIQKENTTVAIKSQQIQRAQTLERIRLDINNVWGDYENARFVLKAEQNSLAISQLNFERTEELFKAGQVSSVEFRQAQLNLLNAATSLNQAKYDVKLIEIQLLQFTGKILE